MLMEMLMEMLMAMLMAMAPCCLVLGANHSGPEGWEALDTGLVLVIERVQTPPISHIWSSIGKQESHLSHMIRKSCLGIQNGCLRSFPVPWQPKTRHPHGSI
jgi:hypothetical protein